MELKCPCCAGPQHCSCVHCKARHKQKVTSIWNAPNGPISCGHCGFTMSLEDWMWLEFEYFEDIIHSANTDGK